MTPSALRFPWRTRACRRRVAAASKAGVLLRTSGQRSLAGAGASYLAAEAAGHAQKLVQLYLGRMGVTSVAQQYLHSLLFSASSMDGLSPQEIELADRVIAHFLSIVSWSSERHSGQRYTGRCGGCLATGTSGDPSGASTPSLRFVSPVPALSGLDELIHMVERDEIPARLNLGGEYSQKALLSVLRHLRAYWAVRPAAAPPTPCREDTNGRSRWF